MIVKCVALIKEYYRKSYKVQVKVKGRKKLKVGDAKAEETEVLYEDWTTEEWQDTRDSSRVMVSFGEEIAMI